MPKHAAVKREPIVEAKVKAGTLAAVVSAFVLSLLGQYVFAGEAPEFVTTFVESAVTSVVVGALTFGGGWLAQHTPRKVVDVEVVDGEH